MDPVPTLEAGLAGLDRLITTHVLAGVAMMMPEPVDFLRNLRVITGKNPPDLPADADVTMVLGMIDERLDEIFSAAIAAVIKASGCSNQKGGS